MNVLRRCYLVVWCLLLDAKARAGLDQRRSLPDGKLILAYATSCDGDGSDVIDEARLGVNVVVWFATNLRVVNGDPRIEFSLNADCIAKVAQKLREENMETAHLISIGGWNAPHPNTTLSGEEWFRVWQRWNQENVSRPEYGFNGFDGFDWDLEGNDDPSSPWNYFTQECLDLVGEMSVAAKSAGFLVTLVPPESYMDASSSAYDRSLRHRYPEHWHTDFLYHGHNVYAYFLAKFPSETWDLVDIQLYETYAHADYYINHLGVDSVDYLVRWTNNVTSGWEVDFGNDPSSGMGRQRVRVPPERLIVGFSFGNTNGKTVFVWPHDVGRAFSKMQEAPRGVMFWNIAQDGKHMFNGTLRENYTFAAGFNTFLRTRGASIVNNKSRAVEKTSDGVLFTKRGFVADGNRTCDDPCLLSRSSWFYDYNVGNPYVTMGCAENRFDRQRFSPMNWCLSSIPDRVPSDVNRTFFLGFNEPNNRHNCNTDPRTVAKAWKRIDEKWSNSILVSPATAGDGILWFDQFFSNCTDLYGKSGCRVEYLAAHDYSCDPTSTMVYLEKLYVRYGKKIWLTEFSCGDHAEARPISDHLRFMEEILPKLDAADFVYRYAWMSARDESGQRGLVRSSEDGRAELTDLGRLYNGHP